MEDIKLKALIRKYQQGKCTPEEKALLDKWYAQLNMDGRPSYTEEDLLQAGEKMRAAILAAAGRQQHTRRWPLVAACIAGLVLIAAGIYIYVQQPGEQPAPQTVRRADVAPGSDKAILTLADGSTIVLDSAGSGQIASQAGSSIVKLDSGQIAYMGKATGQPVYNTLTIPRAGKYRLLLPDGSRVWVNAATTLKYPVSFKGQQQREVYLRGEAYFEVAHNSSQPFVVKSDRQEVTVLGTHFNISAYPDNSTVKTTLLEGSVKVKQLNGNDSCRLIPGRQAVVSAGITVLDANIDDVLDWKDGYFIFDRETLGDILKRLSRWYDVDILYDGSIRDLRLDGIISRNTHLSEVLSMLETTGKVHFKVVGRQVMVSK